MIWLARLEIDADTARAESVSDSYAWHKKLWDCFPNVPEQKRTDIGFLTRIDMLEGAFRIWIMAKRKPARPQWCPSNGFALKEIAASFLTHRYYAFDLRANPVKTIVQRGTNGETLFRANGKRKCGKRVPLVKPEELRVWLDRKAAAGGFKIVEDKPLEIAPTVGSHFRKKGQEAYHGSVQFRGVLEVTDTTQFSETYYTGIGSAKGFGFGLLLLAHVNL
ncbi:MAG: type I-E CRISPR-associated protein Cas6/Cse3/CasE [Nitrospirota bacterium]